MPLLCITCHGGERLPLLENGAFPDAGYIDAKLQALEPDSFEFSDAPGRGRAEQEAAIKFINQAVYESFPAPGEGLPGSHDGEFLRELLAGWYGGVDAQGRLINDRFDGEYVPLGWRPDPDDGIPPQGADELYLQVLAPSCIVCHSRRGRPLQNDVDFSTYEEFISHSAQIQELVYDRGVMPAAFLHFVDFWSGDGAKAQLLGAFLDDFRRGRDDGTTLTPGRALADPGPDRRARSPVSVSGSASAFADAYRWELVSTPAGGEAASLSGATTALVTLTAPVDGDYVLALTVSNERGASEPAEVTISVDAAAPLYGFEQDIKPILQPNCAAECHAPDGERSNAEVDAVPVVYTDHEFLFENVRRRIDLERPEDSLLLTKPSGNHHFGGVRTGFNPDDVGDRGFYDVVLHWILQGAPENAP